MARPLPEYTLDRTLSIFESLRREKAWRDMEEFARKNQVEDYHAYETDAEDIGYFYAKVTKGPEDVMGKVFSVSYSFDGVEV